MAGAPAGFGDALARKYDIQQQTADSEAGLRAAQAAATTGALPFENAVRRAQAYSTTEQGKTLGPLAQASIASTYAGIPAQQAQAGYLGAESGLLGAQRTSIEQETDPASIAFRLHVLNGLNSGQNFGLNAGGVPGYAAGTADVGPGNGVRVAPAPGLLPDLGRMASMHAIMSHALASLHAAGGATTVASGIDPIAGNQGSWEGPLPPPNAQPAPPPPPSSVFYPITPAPTPGRPAFGKRGIQAAGGATSVPSVPGPNQTITGGSWTGPPASGGKGNPPIQLPNGQNSSLRERLGMGKPQAAGGATSIQNYKSGTAKVAGKGPPNVDSVDAKLAPREAVLNAGAADHLGRGTIAALNALGAAKMAAQGMPPATPPTAHGVMAPARGAVPPKNAAKLPMKVAGKKR